MAKQAQTIKKINLLPDVKLAKIRDRQSRKTVLLVGGAVCGVSLITVIGLFLTIQGQNIKLAGLTKSINELKQEPSKYPELSDALTTQQHLASLPSLYAQRPYMLKLLEVLSGDLTADITLSAVSLDSGNKLQIAGNSKSYVAVNKLAKVLEADGVSVGKSVDPKNPRPKFSNVFVSSITGDEPKVGFSITADMSGGVISGK